MCVEPRPCADSPGDLYYLQVPGSPALFLSFLLLALSVEPAVGCNTLSRQGLTVTVLPLASERPRCLLYHAAPREPPAALSFVPTAHTEVVSPVLGPASG